MQTRNKQFNSSLLVMFPIFLDLIYSNDMFLGKLVETRFVLEPNLHMLFYSFV